MKINFDGFDSDTSDDDGENFKVVGEPQIMQLNLFYSMPITKFMQINATGAPDNLTLLIHPVHHLDAPLL